MNATVEREAPPTPGQERTPRARAANPSRNTTNAPATRSLTQGEGPAPININPREPLAHTRIRALQLAEYHGTIGMFLGIENAAETEPTRLRYFYLPAGMTLDDLKRGEEPPTFTADEVLPVCYGLGVAAGLAHVFAYRPGLPGWTPAPNARS